MKDIRAAACVPNGMENLEQPDGPDLHHSVSVGLAQLLRDDIMGEVETMLSEKADKLFHRGQAELGKLQQDRKEVVSCLSELQARQEVLVAEHAAMHGALLDITLKLEFVAKEMREALRALPVRQEGFASTTPCAMAAAGTSPPPAVASLGVGLIPGATTAAGVSAMPCLAGPPLSPPLGPADSDAAVSGAGSHSIGPFTPPPHEEAFDGSLPAAATGSCIAPPLPGSPAVRLSLADALPTAVTTPPSMRLDIAKCLDLDGPTTATDPSRVDGCYTSPLSADPAMGYRADALGTEGNAGGCSHLSSDSSPVGSSYQDWIPASLRVLTPDLYWVSSDPSSQGLKVPGQLRAEAPAFVPGAAAGEVAAGSEDGESTNLAGAVAPSGVAAGEAPALHLL